MDNPVISHPLYQIYEYEDMPDGTMYDWWTTAGTDSDVLFTTVAEAVNDVERHLGLSRDIVVLTREAYDKLADYKFRYEGLDK